MFVIATLSGPNYAPNHDESSIEVHGTVREAAESLLARYNANGRYPVPVQFLDGHFSSTLYPALDEDHYLDLVTVDGSPADEEAVLDALSAVHNGSFDRRVNLYGTGIYSIQRY